MNHWTPLQYAASVVVLCLVVTYVAALQFSQAARSQSWLIIGVPLQALYWSTGKMFAIGAWMSKEITWLGYALTDLWGPSAVARLLWAAYRKLVDYGGLRSYVPRHG